MFWDFFFQVCMFWCFFYVLRFICGLPWTALVAISRARLDMALIKSCQETFLDISVKLFTIHNSRSPWISFFLESTIIDMWMIGSISKVYFLSLSLLLVPLAQAFLRSRLVLKTLWKATFVFPFKSFSQLCSSSSAYLHKSFSLLLRKLKSLILSAGSIYICKI